MFGRKAKRIERLRREINFLNSRIDSYQYQIKAFSNRDEYKDSWKMHYLESLQELQKANKGSRRLRRRLDKQILINKENKP